jgi:cytochrome P450
LGDLRARLRPIERGNMGRIKHGPTGPAGADLLPRVRLPYGQRIEILRNFHTGGEKARAAGGPVCQVPIGPSWLTPRFVFVTSPRGARDVLAGFDGSIDKEMTIHVQTRLVGTNVFDMAHEQWQARRRALQPVFTKQHVGGYVGHMAGEAERVAADCIRDERVDLDHQARRLTLQVLGRSVLGLDLGPRAAALAPHVQTALNYISSRSLSPVRAPTWLPTPARARFRASLSAVQGVADEAIAACRTDPTHNAELIRKLINTIDPYTDEPLTDQNIRDELIAFLVAGHDTTATTLAYSLWQLGHHPDLQERVATEVWTIGDRPLTVADIPRLGYTVQVIHEALRLCPPAAAVGRLTMRDVIIDGHRVAAGTNVIIGIYALHRDPDLWEQPTRFDPDRFSPDRSGGRDRWQYLPFGAGPRSCIGDHFAMLEATIGLASIIRLARVNSLEPDFPLAVPFTMTAGAPIPARISARSLATHPSA